MSEEQSSFSGTTHYASDRVLKALQRTQTVDIAPPPQVSKMNHWLSTTHTSNHLLLTDQPPPIHLAVKAGAADDLESLVKTVFALTHPTMIPELHVLPIDDFSAIIALWQSWMGIRDSWKPVLAAAKAGHHDQVAIRLSQLME